MPTGRPLAIEITNWEGAFSWPVGKGLLELAAEANVLYSGFAAAAVSGLANAGYEVALTSEAQASLTMLQAQMNAQGH